MKQIQAALFVIGPFLIQSLFTSSTNYTYSLFATAILLWFSEIIPLAVTGLLIPTFAVVMGLVDPATGFGAFGNQIIFLFIGSFILAKAFSEHHLDQRVAYFLLSQKMATKSITHLQVFISLICWILSMWISNTAATALMVPLCLGMAKSLKDKFEDAQDYQHFTKSLLFIAAFSSSIGGMATPVGSPPNVLAMAFLSQNGIQINFLEWMVMGIPVSLVMLFLLNLLMIRLYPIQKSRLAGLRGYALTKRKELGKISTAEIQVMCCFLLALLLWIGPGLLKLFEFTKPYGASMSTHFPMGVVALISSTLLFFLPLKEGVNMDWEKAKDIDWGTILIFGGGLALGTILTKTGTAEVVGSLVFKGLNTHYLLILFVATGFGLLMSEFSSNTASASIIIPLILAGISAPTPEHLTSIVVATAFGASFGFMLPVSTPPNAIIYGTGKLKLKEMVRCGISFDVLGLVVIFLMVGLLYPLF